MTKNSCGPRIMKLNRLWTTHYEAEVTSLNSPSPSCVDMKKKKKKKKKKKNTITKKIKHFYKKIKY
jgi:hypothetical protein